MSNLKSSVSLVWVSIQLKSVIHLISDSDQTKSVDSIDRNLVNVTVVCKQSRPPTGSASKNPVEFFFLTPCRRKVGTHKNEVHQQILASI